MTSSVVEVAETTRPRMSEKRTTFWSATGLKFAPESVTVSPAVMDRVSIEASVGWATAKRPNSAVTFS